MFSVNYLHVYLSFTHAKPDRSRWKKPGELNATWWGRKYKKTGSRDRRENLHARIHAVHQNQRPHTCCSFHVLIRKKHNPGTCAVCSTYCYFTICSSNQACASCLTTSAVEDKTRLIPSTHVWRVTLFRKFDDTGEWQALPGRILLKQSRDKTSFCRIFLSYD